jgi:hypothetical protein
MKHIVTLAAAAALMAGVSIANAQGTSSKTGTMSKSGASATNGQYCLDLNGAKNCKYPTLAACQKDVGGGGGKCDKNPNFASKSNGLKSNAMEPKSGTSGTSGTMKK